MSCHLVLIAQAASSHDHVQIVCRYYGVTSLSMRLATSWLTAVQPDLREQFWFPESNPDNIHPTCLGMRYACFWCSH